ncbi:hypothetical protein [Paraburkholderia sp. BL25I1N1]|uniref:hypothetical protein n=1 Tax=Paraburkholderia sp. BL25I1N1 TaxID=1938804 RepID=UPI000D05F386|nr:hypothetical protein [Paraburkholderia sp. BL25I1N1]PRY00279.1 hypothetical protein B0G73_12155 [Paraburkholderia sp. BL25I1N1]
MSGFAKHSRTTSRPPVDALQYEKLALSAFGLIERQMSQLDKLATLTASIVRNPAVTREERHRQRKLLELLLDTCEDYQREAEIDHELYQVIALDAKGVAQSRLTARHASDLLANSARKVSEDRDRIGARRGTQNRPVRFKTTARSIAPAH